ncbi:serine--tRNA ligase-like [Macadamia integrifolia]|uniref:serine--tRNA ligase-like n=1 Tax=Macadamia integrifolia TaxID=60698 RepID=UPI001C4FC3BB|nr:serine--tRNA ligase-like [Macadamia integrifolia]
MEGELDDEYTPEDDDPYAYVNVVIRILVAESKGDGWRRHNIFYTLMSSGPHKAQVIVDNGSCVNVVYQAFVVEGKLKIEPHPQLDKVSLLDNNTMAVTQRCSVPLKVSNYEENPQRPVDMVLLPPLAHVSVEADEFLRHITEVHADVRHRIAVCNDGYQATANHHRRYVEFKPGDIVMVRIPPERFPPGIVHKLHPQNMGPYKVLKRIVPNAYMLEFPPALKINNRDINGVTRLQQVYSIEDSDQCLIGTAEIPVGGIHMDSILADLALPLKYVAYSHCFRTEAGAAGTATRGLYRVHQFSKVEMFILCRPEDSDMYHDELSRIEEDLFSSLGIHFKILDMASSDLGAPAYRKFDVEAWMPGLGRYGEISSASNCTDYQSRRLGIRFRPSDSPTNPKKGRVAPTQFVHTLNATACAVPRMIICLLENFQQEDGSVIIPEQLRPFMGGRHRIIPKSK